MPRQQRRYATVKHGAEYAATSTNTIRRWIQAGKINGFGTGTRFLRVDLNEIDALLEGQRVKVVAA
ncbi:MAG: helix-turn-helix domain-containing protein [Corynebacterium variabile]|uniref:helix-turn-helix domain-containing protein n=1 Tax=Corynebacterium variabile TaxID=1727 RepID=UPI0028AA0104|nr:helix-turn-helix domain-containing protein [Corynebacterium variabile]